MSLCVSAWSAIKLNNYPDFACNSVTCVWSVYVRVAVHDAARQTVARVCIDFVDRWCCIACVATMRCALPFIRQTHYMNITMQYAPPPPHTHCVCCAIALHLTPYEYIHYYYHYIRHTRWAQFVANLKECEWWLSCVEMVRYKCLCCWWACHWLQY